VEKSHESNKANVGDNEPNRGSMSSVYVLCGGGVYMLRKERERARERESERARERESERARERYEDMSESKRK
jgi:hypothetical protein